MNLIETILIGLAIGIVAKLLRPGRDPGGIIITTLLSITGALLARFVGRNAGWYGENEPAGFIASVIGAIGILILYRLFFHRNRV